jgi:hypothetical protein
MEKHVCRELLKLVNDPDTYTALHTYMEARRALLLSRLEQANDMDEVRSIQGALKEVGRLDTLQEEVRKGAK